MDLETIIEEVLNEVEHAIGKINVNVRRQVRERVVATVELRVKNKEAGDLVRATSPVDEVKKNVKSRKDKRSGSDIQSN
jgi:hypothetical protein